jgi:spermidine synthase
VIFHKDGRTATVALVEAKSEGIRSILTNGKADASISTKGEASSDEITMMLAGVLPMLHNPDARSVAIIGFGSGMTTHSVLGNAAVESVYTIEIEPAMVEAAREFRPRVELAYADARSHILIDDAKSFISTNRRKYDIIISEPSNPWVNGVASLFTREFYAFVPKHLNEGGVFAQWIQAYELSPALMTSIVRAMLPYFADIKLYSAGPMDWLLVASPKGQLPHDVGLSLPSSFTPDMRRELHGIGIETGEEIALLFAGDRRILTGYSMMYPTSGTNSDYFPILQLGSPLARFNGSVASELLKLRLADWPVFEAVTGIQPSALDTRLPDYLVQNNALASTTHRARNIRGILEGSIDSHNGSIPVATDRFEVETLKSAASACRLDAMGSDGLLLLTKVAAKTIPYLDTATGTRLWQQAKWTKCPSRNPAIRNYLEFICAIAARNHNATWTIGESILSDPAHLQMIRREKAVLDYLVGGMQVAAVMSGRRSEALKLEERYGPELSQSFVRSYILHSLDLTR